MTRRPAFLSVPTGVFRSRKVPGPVLAGVLAATLALTGCQPFAGHTADGTARPRIVSLNPCTDAILAQVAAPGQLLAISHYSHDPSASSMDGATAAKFAKVSDAVEDIAAFAPDIVVASSFLPAQTAQALRDMGMQVVLEPIPTDVPAALAQVRDLARLAKNRSAGEALAGQITSALERAHPPAGEQPVPALLWQSGGIVAGQGTLIADLMRRAGFADAAAARGLSQADYLPLERVLADPPAVILTVGDPVSEEGRMLHHPALKQAPDMMRAPIDRSLVWCGGPTIPRVLRRLVEVRTALRSDRNRATQRHGA